MTEITETHDYSTLEQHQEPVNVRPKRSVSEILRPRALSDLALPARTIDRLQKMIETKAIMNMLFYGQVGTGKTSAAGLFKDCTDLDGFNQHMFSQFDGLSMKNLAFVRKGIMGWLRNSQICVLDRADLIPKAVQQALPSIIDEKPRSTRFLLTVNERSKIIPELRSRLVSICFDVKPSHRDEVQTRLTQRYESKLAEYGILHDKQRLTEIIRANYPDLRSIAQKIEFEFA